MGDIFDEVAESGKKDIFDEVGEPQPREMFRGGIGKTMSPFSAKQMAQKRLVARAQAAGDDRLILLDENTPEQNVGVKGQGAIPRALAATVGGGFTSGPARAIQDTLVKTGLTTEEAADALGVKRVSEENPGTTLAGNLVGGIIPAGKVFQGASATGRILKAGALGTAFGASEELKDRGIEGVADKPLETAGEALKTGAISTVLPILLESPTLSKAIAKTLLTGKISPETQELIKQAESMDIPITPAQATGSRTLGLTEKALTNIPTSAGTMQKRTEAIQEGLTKKAGSLLDEANPKGRLNEQAFGTEIQSRLQAREGKFKNVASRLYDRFEKSVPEGTEIPLGRARGLAKEFIDREGKKEGFASPRLIAQLKTFLGEEVPDQVIPSKIIQEEKIIQPDFVNEFGVSSPTRIPGKVSPEKIIPGGVIPAKMDVRTFLDVRASLNDEINSAIKNEKGDVARKLGMIKSEMDKSLGDFAKMQGGDVDRTFKMANDFYAKGAKVFNDPKIQRMIQKDPGLVYDMVAQPGTVNEINTLRNALGESRFAPVKRAVMEKVLASDGVDAFSPAKFGTSLGKFTPENLEAVFGKPKVKEIQNFWKVADAVVKNEKRVGNPSGTAQNLITTGYSGGVMSLMYIDPVTASATLIGPAAMAKLYTSKSGMNFLTQAAKTPVGSPKSSQLAAKLSAAISADDDEPENFDLKGRIDRRELEKELTIEKKLRELNAQDPEP
jgi:hypothetical protein